MNGTKRFPAKTEHGSLRLKQIDTFSRYAPEDGGRENKAMDSFSHDPFSGTTDEGAHNRLESRDSLFLMADFRVAGLSDVRPVRVRNLSAGGLMAEFPAGLDQGVQVEVDVRGIGWVPGQVAWCAAGRIGVAFDHQIDPLLARKPVGQGAQTPPHVKPIFARPRR